MNKRAGILLIKAIILKDETIRPFLVS